MQRPEILEPEVEAGWIEESVADEFPDLRLLSVTVAGPARKTPGIIRERLKWLSDVVSAPYAVSLRQRPVAEAYRAFERQIGLDPAADRGPLDRALIERMHRGEFTPAGLPADACLIATLETTVPVWALDADAVVGTLGVCTTEARDLDRLAVADRRGPLALLFASPRSQLHPHRGTESILFYAIGVPDVPDLIVHEALWLAGALASEPE